MTVVPGRRHASIPVSVEPGVDRNCAPGLIHSAGLAAATGHRIRSLASTHMRQTPGHGVTTEPLAEFGSLRQFTGAWASGGSGERLRLEHPEQATGGESGDA